MQMFIGTILLVPTVFENVQEYTKYLPCDGSIVFITEQEELFTLIGTEYGGDGVTTYGLPTLISPLPNFKYVICTKGILPEYVH